MTKEDFKKVIGETLIPEYEAMIPPRGEHEFSPEFEAKMQKLIASVDRKVKRKRKIKKSDRVSFLGGKRIERHL